MLRIDPAPGFAFAADGLTAAAGIFNAAWLWRRLGFERSPARRTAIVALALLNAGAAVQALFALALYSAHRSGDTLDAFFAPGPWLASRLLLTTGVLLVSVLILRRHAQ
jgi:hypothetical protein